MSHFADYVVYLYLPTEVTYSKKDALPCRPYHYWDSALLHPFFASAHTSFMQGRLSEPTPQNQERANICWQNALLISMSKEPTVCRMLSSICFDRAVSISQCTSKQKHVIDWAGNSPINPPYKRISSQKPHRPSQQPKNHTRHPTIRKEEHPRNKPLDI